MQPGSPDSRFDVVVVGSGPAGSTAALSLAQHGRRVLILDKAKLPRYKTCGGGLLQRSLARLPREISAVVQAECRVAELHHHQPELSFSCRREKPVVSMVMRDQFDHRLAQMAVAAGAVLKDTTAVLDLTVEESRARIMTSAGAIDCSYVIAADGVNSTVARKLGYSELPHVVPALEVEGFFDPSTQQRFRDAARFDLGLTPYGYGWVFSKAEHLSLGVLTTRRGSCNLNQEYERYAHALGIGAALREQRHGYMIPIKPRADLFRHSRVLLVGDAAGLADPVIAEGISAAIMSGQTAAQAIVKGGPSPEDVAAYYQRVLESTWLRELKAARFFARCLYNSSWLRRRALRRQGQALADFVTDVVMGQTTYWHALRRPTAVFKLL
jgi:geranylgeranyl reductase family protein